MSRGNDLSIGRTIRRQQLREIVPLADSTSRAFGDPVEHVGAFVEEGLIHRTTRGELVRSKSKVIIAKPDLSSTSPDRRL